MENILSIRYSTRYSCSRPRGMTLPKDNLLFYSRTPTNWLDTGWESNVGWEGELTGWALPLDLYSLVDATTQAFFFSDVDTQIVKSMAEILAWEASNQSPGFAFAAVGKGLAVYSVEPADATETKIQNYFKLL